MAASAYEVESKQFSIGADGTVSGDDGQDGRLAASLGYAARLAAQVEYFLDIGTLQTMSTVSPEGISATVTRDEAGAIGLSVRIETQRYLQPKVFTVVGGAGLQAALAHCVQRVQDAPNVRWAAITTADNRLVAASPLPPGPTVLGAAPALTSVGVRALAALGAIDGRLRESWVQLTYTRGTLLVAAVETHCLYAVVDEVNRVGFGDALDETRAILGRHDVTRADTLATGPTPQSTPAVEEVVAPVPMTPTPAPVGMRYRAPQPKVAKEGKRGFFGR
jgi:hypothetical protein